MRQVVFIFSQSESSMLIKMRAEVRSRENRRAISAADEGTSEHHKMDSVKAWRAEVVVKLVDFETLQWMKVVLAPLPNVAEYVAEALIVRCKCGDGRL